MPTEIMGTLSDAEVAGLRADTSMMIGIDADGNDGGHTQVLCRRMTGRGSLDATTGRYLTPTYLTLYTGAGVVFPIVYRRERQEFVAEQAERLRMYRILLPYNAGEFRENDLCQITAADDAQFVGTIMRITDVLYESDQGLRRLSAVVWEDAGKVAW